jgi:uncharacterized membrane protein
MKLFVVFVLAVCANLLAQEVVKDKDLVIVKNKITPKAVFFPLDVDGMKMEVLAVKAPDGTIRTAFNTCQVCYRSGRAFFKQEGDVLVCQNCKQRFKTNQVGIVAGGCNPVPISEKDKIDANGAITIKLGFLRQAKEIFENWQRN